MENSHSPSIIVNKVIMEGCVVRTTVNTKLVTLTLLTITCSKYCNVGRVRAKDSH